MNRADRRKAPATFRILAYAEPKGEGEKNDFADN
jgi:hypothetical protein